MKFEWTKKTIYLNKMKLEEPKLKRLFIWKYIGINTKIDINYKEQNLNF